MEERIGEKIPASLKMFKIKEQERKEVSKGREKSKRAGR